MKISQLTSILTKASQLLGDAEIKLTHAEGEAETEIKGLAVLISAAEGAETGVVQLVHDAPSAAPVSDTPPVA